METPVNASFSEKLRIERIKLKEMSFKEKVEYIWEYYKFHIIIFAVILIITGTIIYSQVLNPAPETILFISFNGGVATEEQISDLTSYLENRLINEGENEEVVILQMLLIDEGTSINVMNNTRTAAWITVGQLDVFINDYDMLELNSSNWFIEPMDEQKLAFLNMTNPEAYKLIEENFVYMTHKFEDGSVSEYLAGVNIGKSPLLTKLGFIEQDLVYSIAINTHNIGNGLDGLIAFFE